MRLGRRTCRISIKVKVGRRSCCMGSCSLVTLFISLQLLGCRRTHTHSYIHTHTHRHTASSGHDLCPKHQTPAAVRLAVVTVFASFCCVFANYSTYLQTGKAKTPPWFFPPRPVRSKIIILKHSPILWGSRSVPFYCRRPFVPFYFSLEVKYRPPVRRALPLRPSAFDLR